MKNILVVNSLPSFDQSLPELFRDIGSGYFWLAWLDNKISLEKFKIAGFAEKKFFGPAQAGPVSRLAFILFLPLLWARYFFELYFLGKSNKIAKIVCLGGRGKIIFTPLAALFKISVLWLELPGGRERNSAARLKRFSGAAEIVVFTAAQAAELAGFGFNQKKINNISLGSALNSAGRQDNIFYNLARTDKPYSFFKNFTIGAAVEPADVRRLELLLRAAKNCANLIPNLRLVIIGPAPQNSRLAWLIKTLGMENRVWLVGEQKNNLRWFEDFDLYLSLSEDPSLADLENILAAAFHGVPLAALPGKNLADIIIDGETGFLAEKESVESLAQKIMEIEADPARRLAVAENGKRLAQSHFGRDRQIKRLAEIINQ
jgi:glycosyltransferase involved in cell wall biosynthesis